MKNLNYKEKIQKIAETLDLGIPIKTGTKLKMFCPFHEESDGSFFVDIENGTYKCFGEKCRVGKGVHLTTLADNLFGHIVQEKVENISKYKIKTYIDNVSYQNKPEKNELGKITNRIKDFSENFREYEICELAYALINGHTVAPAGIKSQEEWAEQQLVMLDFDNKEETNFTREEVLEYAETINLIPTFSYYTFNHLKTAPSKNKFRFVYCFTEPIRDKKRMECIIKYLHIRFKDFNPDLSCEDIAKKFIGTNNQDIWSSNYLYKPSDRFTEEQLNKIKLLFNIQEEQKHNIIEYRSVSDLLNTELPPLNIVVDDLLHQGITIMAGSPKVGKSWASLYLCIATIKGQPFLGFQTNKCECLYLALEDSDRRIQDRVNKILNGEPLPPGFYYSTKCSTIDTGLIEELENFIEEKPNAKLIIIDTLQKIRGNQSRSDSCYSYDYKEIAKLKEFADKHKICILAIHHLRKMKDSDVFNQISGSTGLTGSADTMIVLNKIENTNEVELSVTGRDVRSIEKTIKFNTKTFKWEVLYDVEERTEEMLYNGNPVVITIKKMLNIYPNGYKTSSSDLIKTIKEITGTYPKQNVPQALTRYTNEILQYQLLKYDGIHYEPPNEHGGSGGRKMFFSKPIIEKTEEQQEETDIETE